MSEQKATTNQPAEADSKALSVKITGQVEALSEEDKALFQIYSNERQSVKMDVPEIRVNYDEDMGIRGGFVLITSEPNEEGKTIKARKFIDTKINVTILRTRFKFGQFDENEGEKGMEVLGTPELDDYTGEVNLWDNKEKKIIFTGLYKEFKKFIVSNYPDLDGQKKGFPNSSTIKHTEILYVEYEGRVCRMYLNTSSRNQYWAYKEEIKGVPTFAFQTSLTTTKEKQGAITYFPIHFEKIGDNELKKYIHLRKQLDNDLKLFDEARANSKPTADEDTVRGGNPEEEIIKKWGLDKATLEIPNCPKCGEKMVLRDSFKGPFFGCSKFPDCDGIVKVERTEVLPVINLGEDEKEEIASATAPEPVIDLPEEKEGEISVKNIPF